ncbi:MAG TPA: redoxin domain-containing protein [Asticcacaulis sp.]|nr:redoxin domain-containing protein [Asticcacaulis sp.]
MDNPLDSDGTGPKAVQGQPQPAPNPAVDPAPTPIAEAAAEPKGQGPRKPKKNAAKIWLFACIVASVALVVGVLTFAFSDKIFKSPVDSLQSAADADKPKGPLAVYAKGGIATLVTYETPKSAYNFAFTDRDHKSLHLADFKGQVVILNLWATWCHPCRTEMPTLAHLQSMYAGKGVKVLPVSLDDSDKFDDVKSFIDVQEPLDVYAGDMPAALNAYQLNGKGLPVVIIIDKNGKEVARNLGGATWDTPEMKGLVDKLLSE